MRKFVCTVCGYVHEGTEPPERCPQCKAPKEKFILKEKFVIKEEGAVNGLMSIA